MDFATAPAAKGATLQENKTTQGEPAASSKEVLDLAVTAINKFSGSVAGEISSIANTLQSIAEKGTRTFLLAFGATVMALSVIMKFEVYGFHLAKIEPREFISMLVLGVVLVLAGTGFELYGYHRRMNVYQEEIRGKHKVQSQLAEIAMAGLKASSEAAGHLASTTSKPDGIQEPVLH